MGTHTIVVHVMDNAVTFLSIPYGTRNILVLVIGRIELMVITANHALGINPMTSSGIVTSAVSSGVIMTERKKMLLIHDQ